MNKKKKLQYYETQNELWINDVVEDEKLIEFITVANIPNDCKVKYAMIGDVAVTDVGTIKEAFKLMKIHEHKNDSE